MANCKKPPTRVWIALMIFFAVFTTYVIRLHFSLLIVAMVKHKKGKTAPACDPKRNMTGSKGYNGPKFDWDESLQSQLLAAYPYGFIFTNILGGVLAEVFGPKQVIFWTNVVSGVLTLVTGFSARIHWSVVLVARIILGLMGGMLYPAVQSLLANWAPPQEKGKFVALLMGNTIGSCVCLPTVGAIAEYWDFDVAYVVCGTFVLVFSSIFFVLVSDKPHNHWFISEEEREFIITSQEGTVSGEKRIAPFLKIMSNCHFLAACCGHFGNMWGVFLQMTLVPKFLAEVLGFDLKSSGGLSALPYLARFFSGIFFGTLGDVMKRKKWLSTTNIRRIFTLSSHVIPGLLLGVVFVAKCKPVIVIALMVISLMFNGAVVITVLQVPHDLAPSFAGTLYGIMQTFGGVPGFAVPAINGEFIKNNNGIDEWKWTFVLGAAVYVGTGIIFMIFCSGNIQAFNEEGRIVKKEEEAGNQ